MLVFGDVEAFDMAVSRARGDHRDLALERNKYFEDGGSGAEVLPDPVRIIAVADDRLALAVVAEAAGLDHRGQADARDRGAQGRRRRHIGVIGGADPQLFHEVLFGEAILRGFQDFPVGQQRTPRRQDHRGGCGHILEFVSDDVDVVGEQLQRLDIGIFRASRVLHHVEGGGVRIGREHLAFQPEPRRRHGQHPAQLPAAENSDGVARLQLHGKGSRHAKPSGRSLTASVCCLRHAAKRAASAGSFSASTEAASSAALTAPALPIASVPTGTPAGICTIE